MKRFKNSKRQYLCGILSGPSPSENRPVVVLCHGLGSNKESYTNQQLEKRLTEKNIATFRFDFSGHGESEGKQKDITLSQAIDDIHSAIEYLTKTDLQYSKLGLVGSSFGGSASLIAASQSDKVSFLALRSPISNYRDLDFKVKAGIALKLITGFGSLDYGRLIGKDLSE